MAVDFRGGDQMSSPALKPRSARFWPRLVRRGLYPLHERLLARPTCTYLAAIEASQWLERDRLETLQFDRLKRLLSTALRHSPWHAERIRSAGLDLAESARLGWDDLRRLPLMDRADARDHGDAMVWRGVPGGAQPYTTGGSSGEPLIFHYGKTRQAADQAARIRARRWWGVDVGDPEVYLWGAPIELSRTDRIKSFRDRLFNQLLLNAFAMSPAQMDRYLDALSAFQPCCMYGYASSLALLAAHGRERGRRPRWSRLRVVCTTGEPLFPHQRELIESYFGVPAANEFGSRDAGFLAHQAPGGELLQFSEGVILEVLCADGSPAAAGEVGEAVITGLNSEAQPFIRYRTGDLVRLSDEPSRTGRGLHVISEVIGRQTDFLVRADGTIMHALAAIYILRSVPGVAEFKVIQEAVDALRVNLVVTPAWRPAAVAAIEAQFRQRLGMAVRVEVAVVESIPPEPSGKHRYVVSRVPLPSVLRAVSGQGQ